MGFRLLVFDLSNSPTDISELSTGVVLVLGQLFLQGLDSVSLL